MRIIDYDKIALEPYGIRSGDTRYRFRTDQGGLFVCLQDPKKLRKRLLERIVSEVELNKTFCVAYFRPRETDAVIQKLRDRYSAVKFTNNIEKADYIITPKIYKTNLIEAYEGHGSLGIIKYEDDVYKISLDDADLRRYKTIEKAIQILKKDYFPNAPATIYRSGRISLIHCDDFNFAKEVCFGDKKFIEISNFEKQFVSQNQDLTKDNLLAINELLKSPDEDNVKLGIMMLGTSNYMKYPISIRTVVYNNSNNIAESLGYFYGKSFPEQEMFTNLHLGDVFVNNGTGMSSFKIIYTNKLDSNEDDLKIARELLIDRYKECLNNYISKPTMKALKDAGFKIQMSIDV